jgi:hypothetical protein
MSTIWAGSGFLIVRRTPVQRHIGSANVRPGQLPEHDIEIQISVQALLGLGRVPDSGLFEHVRQAPGDF